LPIPPLDGFGAIAPWLPAETRAKLYGLSQIGLWITFLALWYIPLINGIFWSVVHQVVALLGIPPHLGWEGYQLFKVW
jgi:Zn-dependent protease